jgi:acyl-CoA thioesterase-1
MRKTALVMLLVPLRAGTTTIAGEPPQGTAAQTAAPDRLTVHNKGIGGQNTEQGKARFEADVLALKPDYVFIYFGLNDTLNEPRFLPLDKFIANLAWMAERACKAGIKPVLCTIHRVTEEPLLKRHRRESYGSEGPNGKIARYNAAIGQLAKDKDVPLADFAAVVQRNPSAVSTDGVHLTAAGSRLLAQCFFDTVASELQGHETIVCLGDSVTWGAGLRGAGTAEGETYPAFLKLIRPVAAPSGCRPPVHSQAFGRSGYGVLPRIRPAEPARQCVPRQEPGNEDAKRGRNMTGLKHHLSATNFSARSLQRGETTSHDRSTFCLSVRSRWVRSRNVLRPGVHASRRCEPRWAAVPAGVCRVGRQVVRGLGSESDGQSECGETA